MSGGAVKHGAVFRHGTRSVVAAPFTTAALAEEFGREHAAGDLEYVRTVEVVNRAGLQALARGIETQRLTARMAR